MLTGEITVLVGSSGCGKTTTLRMVNRMVEPTERHDHDRRPRLMTSPPHELRRGIGYVIQQVGLFPHRTVIDNVTTVPRLLGWDKKRATRQRALELLELVGLPADYGERYPAQLSGGQQQRVGVARALAADPPVLLMDEPFGAVDPIVRAQLQQEFLRLQRELHKTIVFVTHDVDEAILLGDRIAVLTTGAHIEQLAPPAELLARPANDFVADFLGNDRGLKLLSLCPPPTCPSTRPSTSTAGASSPTIDSARSAGPTATAPPRCPCRASARTNRPAASSTPPCRRPPGCAVRVDDDRPTPSAWCATRPSASCWPIGCRRPP